MCMCMCICLWICIYMYLSVCVCVLLNECKPEDYNHVRYQYLLCFARIK